MDKGKKTTAIIAAAGSGKRLGGDIPKQFLELKGTLILERTVSVFEKNSHIDEIILVVPEDYIAFCRQHFSQNDRFMKIKKVLGGGQERQDSVYAALKELDESVDYILIHDGARPFVSSEIIDRVVGETILTGAVVTATPVKDTIKAAHEGVFTETLDRSSLFAVQTPQGFEKKLLLKAYAKAYAEGFYGTDDAVLVEQTGYPVHVSEGDYRNIKITTREDLLFGEALLTEQERGTEETATEIVCPQLRIGTGYDVHRLVEGRPCILGGVLIPFERGLLGHSDADVLLHALMDALLGAAALGDIGRHFPDQDATFAGISSLNLLGQVKDLLAKKGFQVVNVDVTLIAQKPKIAPYIESMRANIARTLAISVEQVNVKGTTTEKLGFCGREEGIAAQAVAFIKR